MVLEDLELRNVFSFALFCAADQMSVAPSDTFSTYVAIPTYEV
jgi:hypothetical protein